MSVNVPFRVLALVPDLLTNMRIEAGVQRMGGFLDVVEEPAGFFREIEGSPPQLALIDLSYAWIDVGEAVVACMHAGVPLRSIGFEGS